MKIVFAVERLLAGERAALWVHERRMVAGRKVHELELAAFGRRVVASFGAW